ncbi:MAG: hypothetical protein E6J32_13385 [Chloroflexi bacterium]|nr:MAG: hypothetical protein E6J32_13385 [Chloroflexota bacterium]
MAVAACSQCGGAVPEEARFCPHCSAPTTPNLPTEERKIATILFADLVGSTELGASQDPERTRVVLGRFYEAMSAEVEAAGGTVEKFVGDAVMAAFGTPTAHEDDAERALRAGLAMRRRCRERRRKARADRLTRGDRCRRADGVSSDPRVRVRRA